MKYLIVFTILFSSFISYGQVEAPNLYCVSYDTLNWELPTVSCGAIQGYEVYVSTDFDGPYTLEETITDISEIQAIYTNPTGELRYYFMRTIADCPGETFLNSDTLDNRIPPLVSIDYVSVEAGGVRIQWTEPQTEENLLYRIFRVTVNGTVNIGEISGTNTFLDAGASPDEKVEYYYVVAVDNCGNQGLYDVTHQTVFIEDFQVQECAREISVSFSPYSAWGNDIEEYRIMVSENGGPFQIVSTVSEVMGIVTSILDNIDYRIRIDAVHNNGLWLASSQTIQITTEISQPLTDYHIINATYAPDNSGVITIIWEWNADASLISALFEIGDSGSPSVNNIEVIPPLTQKNTYMLSKSYDIPPLISGLATDSCRSTLSDKFQLINLSGSYLDKQTIKLDWSDFEYSDSSSFIGYELTALNEDYSEIETIDVGKFNTYSYINTSQSGVQLCFKVEGVYDYVSRLSPTPERYRSQSNIVCVVPEIILHFPNAIAPSSSNRTFKPKGLFLNNIEDYHLRVFTRDGREIFHSEEVDLGWDGRIKGVSVASGVYVYRASFMDDGEKKEYSGIITVIY